MSKFSKAQIAQFRMTADGDFNARIEAERQHYDTMTEAQRDTCDKKVAAFKRYYAHVNDDASMLQMMMAGVDSNFVNNKGTANKYTVMKAYQMAEFLSGVSGKLDLYCLRVFRTLYNFAKAGKACKREHLLACIDHNSVADDALVFRITGKRADTSTAQSQQGSSVANFKIYNMVREVTCADTGKPLFELNLEAHATKQMIARLRLEA